MPYFLVFLGTAIIVFAVTFLIQIFKEIEIMDGIAIAAFVMMLTALFSLGVIFEIEGIDKARSKIETKEIIVPDTLVFTKNGVSDTTYVYNYPNAENVMKNAYNR